MPSASFQVGGFPVDPGAWPEAWLALAARRYPRSRTAVDRPLRMAVAPRVGGARRDRFAPTRVRVDGDRVSIDCPPDVRAEFCVGAGTLDVAIGPVDGDEGLHMAIENVLRCYVSVRLALHLDGVMVHAASAVREGRGVLFAGLSGAGKTTLARGFERAAWLSDDLSLLDRVSERPRLLPSPFFGRIGAAGADVVAPLAAVALLEQGPTTRVTRLGTRDATSRLFRHVVAYDPSPVLCEALLQRVATLARAVPVVTVQRSLSDPADAVLERVLEATAS